MALYGCLLDVTGGKERMLPLNGAPSADYRQPAGFDDLVALAARRQDRILRRRCSRTAASFGGRRARRLLAEARARCLRFRAVATTTTPANGWLLHHALGTEGESWFGGHLRGRCGRGQKPAPDIYCYVLERLGLAPTRNGVRGFRENGSQGAARGAGIPTVITINDYTRDHDFTGAALVLDSPGKQTGRSCFSRPARL